MNALRLSARKRGSETIERQVVQAHRIQKIQPLPHFVQNRPGNLLCMGDELEAVEELLALAIVSAAASQMFSP